MASPKDIRSPPEFTFTPSDTRLKITYENAPAYAHVSSHAMALASPVWKNFFFPPWKNETAQGDIVSGFTKLRIDPVEEIDFTEDNAEALLVLLCVAHLKFEDVLSHTPSRKLLVRLAIMCDAYLCQNLLKPWIGGWMDRQWRRNARPEQPRWWIVTGRNVEEDKQAMMLLGRIFQPQLGNEVDFFHEAVEWLYKRSKEILPDVPNDWPLPADIMDKISDARTRTIKDLLEIAHEYFDYLASKKEQVCSEHTGKCWAQCLEFYKALLSRLGLYPWNLSENPPSIDELRWIDYTQIGVRYAPEYIKIRCDYEIQKKFQDKAENLNSEYMITLLENIRPAAGSKSRAECEAKRIERVTGLWHKSVPDGESDWSD